MEPASEALALAPRCTPPLKPASRAQLQAWGEILAKPVHELAKEFGISPFEALKRQLEVARKAAPCVLRHQPQIVEIDYSGEAS